MKYRLKIKFFVQRDIVTGLKYSQTSYRKGIRGESKASFTSDRKHPEGPKNASLLI